MNPFRRRAAAASATPPAVSAPDTSGVEMGWRVHTAQESWTAKVDIKASIVLALATAVLVGVVAGTTKDAAFDNLVGWRQWTLSVAVIADLAAVVLAAVAIWPQLGRQRENKTEHRKHFIYFGHLRHWAPDELAERLRSVTPEEERQALAEQLIRMSERNWTKHKALQGALAMVLISVGLVALTAIWP